MLYSRISSLLVVPFYLDDLIHYLSCPRDCFLQAAIDSSELEKGSAESHITCKLYDCAKRESIRRLRISCISQSSQYYCVQFAKLQDLPPLAHRLARGHGRLCGEDLKPFLASLGAFQKPSIILLSNVSTFHNLLPPFFASLTI